VGPLEFASVGVLTAVTLGFEFFVPPPDKGRWSGPILFDSGVRDLLVLNTPKKRESAKNLSDVLFYWSIAHPAVVDNFIITWAARGAPDVAWEMFVINSQAYALTLTLNTVSKRLTSRERPWGDRCDNPEDDTTHDCDGQERYRSFYSGHAAVTATGAGLICAHHTQLQLYKEPLLDAATCVTAVLGTAVTGAMRISSDNHWASDVITGHLMGYLSGYLLPTLLYYKEFRLIPEQHHEEDRPPEPIEPTIAVLPMVSPKSIQLTAIGVF
jgi:membrane-associated phospholipid phosphatase